MLIVNFAFIFLTAAPPVALCGLTISEVMFDPQGDESTDEFIELYNDSALPVDLRGWTISDGSGTDTLADVGHGLFAGPRQFVLVIDPDYITEGSLTYDDLIDESALVVSLSGSTFGNRGLSNSSSETLSLYTNLGVLESSYAYTIGNVPGHSDEKIRLSGPNDSTNWGDGVSLHGTPSRRNSLTPVDFDLQVGSIESIPDFPEPQSICSVNVEILNSGLYPLSGVLSIQVDTVLEGSFFTIHDSETGTIQQAETLLVQSRFIMPLSGLAIVMAALDQEDDNEANNFLLSTVSSEFVANGLLFSELQVSPLPGRAEWIELVAAGPIAISTRGMSIGDGAAFADVDERIALPEWILESGSFAIVSNDSSIFLENIPVDVSVLVTSDGNLTLNNTGDSLALFSPSGSVSERVDYRQSWLSSTSGVSIERISTAVDANLASNWSNCVDAAGSTPGRENSQSLQFGESGTTFSIAPIIFTPNGDGIDDVVLFRYETDPFTSECEARIFDARGREINRVKLQNNGSELTAIWDGRRENGETANTGRYIVLLEASDGKGGTRRKRLTGILARPR